MERGGSRGDKAGRVERKKKEKVRETHFVFGPGWGRDVLSTPLPVDGVLGSRFRADVGLGSPCAEP